MFNGSMFASKAPNINGSITEMRKERRRRTRGGIENGREMGVEFGYVGTKLSPSPLDGRVRRHEGPIVQRQSSNSANDCTLRQMHTHAPAYNPGWWTSIFKSFEQRVYHLPTAAQCINFVGC